MATLQLSVVKDPAHSPTNPAKHARYSVTLVAPTPAQVSSDTSLMYPSPDAALAEVEKKLTESFKEGDTIRFGAEEFTDVASALAAVTDARPDWE